MFMSLTALEGIVYFVVSLIIFMAVLAELQSTTESVLLIIGSVFSKDIYKQ